MEISENLQQAEFVITAPEDYSAQLAYYSKARMTLGVLTQLISQSKKFVIISAPFLHKRIIFDKGPVADSLRAALIRGVDVHVVSTGGGFKSINIDTSLSLTKGNLRFYRPAANIVDENKLGSHAKFCIADGEHAYIGSANLTGSGLNNNLEMGVLVHGELAKQVEKFWKTLIEFGFFVEQNSAGK